MSITPKASWPWVKTLLHSVYDQPDAQSVREQFDLVLDALADKLPAVADHLEQARADARVHRVPQRPSGDKSGPTTPKNG
jgi:transposase-like protein